MRQYLRDYWSINDRIFNAEGLFDIQQCETLIEFYRTQHCTPKWFKRNHAAFDFLNTLEHNLEHMKQELNIPPPLTEG